MSAQQIFVSKEAFITERGDSLPGFQIAYSTYGKPNTDKSNIIWITHALTANCKPNEWWKVAFGEGKALDPDQYFIICANFIGSPYGSTSPLSINETTGKPYGKSFPLLSPLDLARSFSVLANALGIDEIQYLIGPSYGGQQALEWAIIEPQRIKKLCLIATNPVHSGFGKAFNAAQRMAIETDPSWNLETKDAGKDGLITARAIAMLSYRSYQGFAHQSDTGYFHTSRAQSYLQHQGKKLSSRFPAVNYWFITQSMDQHDVGRDRDGIENALRQVEAETLVINISSDILFPFTEQKCLARHIPKATLKSINSKYGHDGFLIEPEINTLLKQWLNHPTRHFVDIDSIYSTCF